MFVPMSRRVGLPLVVTMKALVIGLTALGAFGGLARFEIGRAHV